MFWHFTYKLFIIISQAQEFKIYLNKLQKYLNSLEGLEIIFVSIYCIYTNYKLSKFSIQKWGVDDCNRG